MSVGAKGHQIRRRRGRAQCLACESERAHRSWRLMSSSPSPKRLLLAFLVAPFAAPVAYVVGTLAVEFFRRGYTLKAFSALDLVIGTFTLGAPCAYVAALVLGVPTYFVLRRLGWLTRWTIWLAGAAIGAAGALALAPYLRGDLFSIRFPWWVAALLGLVSAEVFWRIWSARVPGDPR